MPLVRVTPILSSARASYGSRSFSVSGQSIRLAPAISPSTVRVRNSCSWKRSDAPAQWVVVPPTVLQIHAGRPAKSFARRQVPLVVSGSSQASWLNDFHSSLMKLLGDCTPPASSTTTLMPFWYSSLASVPPPAPEPMMTTTESSPKSNVARVSPMLFWGGGISPGRAAGWLRRWAPAATSGPGSLG